MIQPLPVPLAAAQLELIGEPRTPPPTRLSAEMVPVKTQHQCVELLAELLSTLVTTTGKGDQDER